MVSFRAAGALKLERILFKIAPGYLASTLSLFLSKATLLMFATQFCKQERTDQMDDDKWKNLELTRWTATLVALCLLSVSAHRAESKEMELPPAVKPVGEGEPNVCRPKRCGDRFLYG